MVEISWIMRRKRAGFRSMDKTEQALRNNRRSHGFRKREV